MSDFSFPERALIDGERIDANVAGLIRSAKLVRPYQGATSIEMRLADPGGVILRSGLLSKRGKPTGRAKGRPQFAVAPWARWGESRLVVDGIAFRLAGVQPSYGPDGETLLITWEDELAATLRRYKRRVVIVRDQQSGWTRAEFIAILCSTARVRYDIPEVDTIQPLQGNTAHERAKLKRKGIDKNADLTIKGETATRTQIRLLEQSLAQADEDRAGERAAIAMLCGEIAESTVSTIMNTAGSGYGGILGGDVTARYHYFKATDTEPQVHYFLVGGKGYQAGGAIKAAAANPGWSAGTIAYKVLGSRSNFASDRDAETFYGQHEDEATAILDAWGGIGRVVLDRQKHEFRNPKGTSFFDTCVALAQEVNARFFITENVVNYVSDDYLIGLEPIFALGRRENGDWLGGMISIAGAGEDIGQPISELEVVVTKPLWTGRAGIPATVKGMGPMDGRWLLANADEDLYEHELPTLTLHRPTPLLPEPAQYDTITQTETTPERGSTRERIVAAAQKALDNKRYLHYAQTRPYPSTLFPEPRDAPRTGSPIPRSVYTDCSGFVTLCYKRAGAPDPNGLGYNGSGYTGTLIAHGQKTSDPQPGDLVFYGIDGPGPDHVGVYVGGGEVIEFGSEGGPYKVKTHYRSDFNYFRTYDLG